QINILTELGEQSLSITGTTSTDTEVSKLARVIGIFKDSLLQLRQQKQVLSDTNQSLIETSEQLRQARDKLELRVQERTLELRQKNETLQLEIELRKQAEAHLRIYAEVIESTAESVVITDLSGRITEVNPAYEHAIGQSRDELIGRALYDNNGSKETQESY